MEYIEAYINTLKEIIIETISNRPNESEILVNLLNDWIDLLKCFIEDEDILNYTINTISGVLYLELWKVSNWIIFEILCGKYFEAKRDLRFLLEGSAYGILIEDIIRKICLKHFRALPALNVKREIFYLLEKYREEKVKLKTNCKSGYKSEIVRRIIEDYVKKGNLPETEEKKYIEAYTEILEEIADYSIGKIIRKSCEILNIPHEDLLKKWSELSKYVHFSYPYLELKLEHPEDIFLERFDEKLFKECVEDLWEIIDFLYCSIIYTFKKCPEAIRMLKEEFIKINKWWKENFGRELKNTKILLQRISEKYHKNKN